MGLALWVYRKRDLENAGDFISLKPLAPVFLVIYTLCAGLLLYYVAEIFEGEFSYWFLAVGLIVGFFTGQMLLKRTIRVFTKKAIFGLFALAAVFVGSMWVTWLDPMGITTYIPPMEDVEWAAIYTNDDEYRYNEEYNKLHYKITDPAELEALQAFHEQLTKIRFTGDGYVNGCDIEILYERSDGSRVIRYYSVPEDSKLGREAKSWLSDARYLLGIDDPEHLADYILELQADRMYDVEWGEKEDTVTWLSLTEPEQIQVFAEAFQADCQALLTTQAWEYHEDEDIAYYLGLYMEMPGDGQTTEQKSGRIDLRIWKSCTNTVACLDDIFTQYQNEK